MRLRDVERLTFSRIAEEIGMGEKEARIAYYRYVEEVAPLLAAPSADGEIAEALRRLDDVAQGLWRILDKDTNDNARVGAARLMADLIFRSIELRQNLGLLPRPLSQVVDNAWMVAQIRHIFEKHKVAAEAIDEIEQVFREGAKEEP